MLAMRIGIDHQDDERHMLRHKVMDVLQVCSLQTCMNIQHGAGNMLLGGTCSMTLLLVQYLLYLALYTQLVGLPNSSVVVQLSCLQGQMAPLNYSIDTSIKATSSSHI